MHNHSTLHTSTNTDSKPTSGWNVLIANRIVEGLERDNDNSQVTLKYQVEF